MKSAVRLCHNEVHWNIRRINLSDPTRKFKTEIFELSTVVNNKSWKLWFLMCFTLMGCGYWNVLHPVVSDFCPCC